MTFSVRLLVLAAALAALALTTATSLAGRNARARAEAESAETRDRAGQSRRAETAAASSAGGSRPTAGDPGSRAGRRGPTVLGAGSVGADATRVADAATRDRAPSTSIRASRLRIRAGRSVAVRGRPGGNVIGRLGARTEFGSPQVVAAVRTQGRWVGVASTVRSDGRLGWVDRESSALRPAPARYSIRADLSRRKMVLRRGDRVVARASVAIGRPGSSTPTGRFAITDKLDGRRLSPYYGCCVLALSGTQPNLPAGWSGGNRLAIHGTNDPSSIGEPSSAGCLRASDSDLKKLVYRVPLGTPVEIRR